MRNLILYWGLILLSVTSFAQKQSVEFGKIKPEDLQLLKMKAYPKDSSADAVVLYDYGETDFTIIGNELYIRTTYHERIKILNKSAFDLANVHIQYYWGGNNKSEIITNIKGYTYNLENGVVKQESLTKDMIFDERSSDGFSSRKITLPNVKEGSIIEYTYEDLTPWVIRNSPAGWKFQGERPVEWSEYRITIPQTLYYRMVMSGFLGLYINESKPADINLENLGTRATSYRFVVKDAPAFRNEPFITTYSDYISTINFALARVDVPGSLIKNISLSWKDLNNTLLSSEYIGGQLERTGFLKDAATRIKAQTSDTTAQLEAAMKYIQNSVRWNGEINRSSESIKKALEKREGDSGDINLLLTALLREIGYDAHPLILSTRQHGRIDSSYAMINKFNALVAHLSLNGKDVLLDGTDEFLKVGMLPDYCLNQVGWLLHPKNARFVAIKPTELDRNFEKADLTIGEDGELTGTFTRSYGGYSGWNARKKYKAEGEARFVATVKEGRPSWDISKTTIINQEAVNLSMDATFELSMHDYVTQAGDMLYLKPMLSEAHTENALKAETRAYPVDFAYPKEEVFVATYRLPAGYKVLEQPKPVAVNLPNNEGRFLYAVSVNDKQVTVTSRIHLRKAVFGADEYSMLKMFYDQIIAKHNEQIVLKKAN
ncbi:DUF3857 domain-containing protein [Telluribacter sp. SYSU D00476]|uniref:DUF3857 domain-containing protein n=1 Tax=Telluribacter sp. SYSU D00476 TaxID=2811430 RepID=UPI001FF0E3F1|nr:DUF3857 domain-containing protein [Telluribacter sp. SYSU D00476]